MFINGVSQIIRPLIFEPELSPLVAWDCGWPLPTSKSQSAPPLQSHLSFSPLKNPLFFQNFNEIPLKMLESNTFFSHIFNQQQTKVFISHFFPPKKSSNAPHPLPTFVFLSNKCTHWQATFVTIFSEKTPKKKVKKSPHFSPPTNGLSSALNPFGVLSLIGQPKPPGLTSIEYLLKIGGKKMVHMWSIIKTDNRIPVMIWHFTLAWTSEKFIKFLPMKVSSSKKWVVVIIVINQGVP